jgi:glycosyltransferase involved in cell wall biosynthesis
MICSLNTDWKWEPAARPRLVMRGFDPNPEQFEREIAAIGGFKDAMQYLIARPYTADAETIATDIRSSSAIIMPSKREGFGLTAVEGIAAGIPILVSSESGLAWLLLEPDIQAAIGKATADACVADVDGNADDIKKDWANRAQAILSDPARAFSDAKQMRAALISQLSWEKAAEKFSRDVDAIL